MQGNDKQLKRGIWRMRLGYGASDFACNLVWQMISLYLLFFYTNIMHLDAVAISVMFLVTRIIDGGTDLLVGVLVDRTNTRWGKSRPWILCGAFPFAIFAILAFSVPDISPTGMLIYAYITYIGLSFAYTMVNIPMASILPALTADPQERTNLASSRVFFSFVGATVVSSSTLGLVEKFGQGNQALGFRIVMMIFGTISCLVFIFTFFNTKERVTIRQKEKVNIAQTLKAVFNNKPYLVFLANIIWMFGGYTIQMGAIIYYFTYVIGSTSLASIVATLSTLLPIISNFMVPLLSKKIIKRNIFQLGSAIQLAGLVIVFLGGVSTPIILAGVAISSLGFGIKQSIYFSMQADPVDYSEWKSGLDVAGTMSAVNGFVGKVAMAIAGSASAALLAMGGYDANLTTQPESAQTAITVMYIVIPVVSIVLGMITMAFYNLDTEYPKIKAELEARNTMQLKEDLNVKSKKLKAELA